MKKQIKGAFAALFIVAALASAGCAAQAVSILTPAPNSEQTESLSAVRAKCTSKALDLMPKSLGLFDTIPPQTYSAVYHSYAACAQEHGYEAQCQSSNVFLCGMNLTGFQ